MTTLILGIETSCDETAAAVVADGRTVLSNVVATQHALHEEFAGVVPEIASRAHLERIQPVVRASVSEAEIGLDDVSAIAVGHRPGLIGSLLVGIAAAKALAWSLGKPLIGVDHVLAHIHAATLNSESIAFPALGLVASGGHTSLYVLESELGARLIGRTIDDAVGEAFDKAGAILGLAYPGGPEIDQMAQRGDAEAHELPVPAKLGNTLDFSFSGLKTAFLYAVRGQPRKVNGVIEYDRRASDWSDREKADFAAAFQAAAVSALINRVEDALERHPDTRSLVIGGGVSANSLLRSEAGKLARSRGITLRLPAPEFCIDNAAMIAGHAFIRHRAGQADGLDLAASTQSAIGR